MLARRLRVSQLLWADLTKFRIETQFNVETQLCPLIKRSIELETPSFCEGRHDPCIDCRLASNKPIPVVKRCVPNKDVDENDVCSEGLSSFVISLIVFRWTASAVLKQVELWPIVCLSTQPQKSRFKGLLHAKFLYKPKTGLSSSSEH